MSGATAKPLLTRLFRYVKWAVMALALAYFAQFVWGSLHKGQSRMGSAIETIAHEAFKKQYDGLPQMRVVGAGADPTLCSFWNFEWVWGRCLTIAVDVRDYEPDYQIEHLSIVAREVEKLAEQVRRPCNLLVALRLPNGEQLARDLECSSPFQRFRLRIFVYSVTVKDPYAPGPMSKPHRWQIEGPRKHLNTFHFEGDL
jgi:hypothetical protein